MEYKYELKDDKILKDGHTMFLEDVIKDLNYLQRNHKDKQNKCGLFISSNTALNCDNCGKHQSEHQHNV